MGIDAITIAIVRILVTAGLKVLSSPGVILGIKWCTNAGRKK